MSALRHLWCLLVATSQIAVRHRYGADWRGD
ncbi:hypothetical protein FHW96_003539 [Novosphingobium sp. SG751A]|nr:hypothetical protein [Novosphingobium sp. SG751A]